MRELFIIWFCLIHRASSLYLSMPILSKVSLNLSYKLTSEFKFSAVNYYANLDYYGYTKVTVREATEEPIPELLSIEIPDPPKDVKELENKICYHSKSIRELKNTIHEIRGDYDNPDKYSWTHTCKEHGNCEIYQKKSSLKNTER